MQLNYNMNQARAVLGVLADSRLSHTESKIAHGLIPVGAGVAKVIGSNDQIRLASPQTATVTFDGDLVAANEINMTVNGEAMAAVTYAVSHDDTMDAIIAELITLPTVLRATLTDAVNNRQITIVSVGDAILVEDAEVTLGGGQAATAVAYVLTVREFEGIARRTLAMEDPDLPGVAGPANYSDLALVNVLRRGAIFVNFETAFDPDVDALFMRYLPGGAGTAVGSFRNDNAGGQAIDLSALPIVVRESVGAPGLAVVELNLP